MVTGFSINYFAWSNSLKATVIRYCHVVEVVCLKPLPFAEKRSLLTTMLDLMWYHWCSLVKRFSGSKSSIFQDTIFEPEKVRNIQQWAGNSHWSCTEYALQNGLVVVLKGILFSKTISSYFQLHHWFPHQDISALSNSETGEVERTMG